VINRQLGTGTSIFQLTGTGSPQTPDGANALMRAINSQNLDDTFATTSFIIGNPAAFIDPIGDHAVGDKFTISGSTNLAAGNTLLVEITSSSFKPSQKSQSGEFSGSSGTVTVQAGSGGMNRWSFYVDASTFRPDEYLVRISGTVIEVSGSTTFNIYEKLPTTVKTSVPTTTGTAVSLPGTTSSSPPPTTQKSPVSSFGIIAAIAMVAGILRTKRK
jgi:hypothetical protein